MKLADWKKEKKKEKNLKWTPDPADPLASLWKVKNYE